MSDNGLVISAVPTTRNGTATVTAKLNEEVIAVDSFNLAKSTARANFISAVCDNRPGIDRKAVELELMRLADELTVTPGMSANASELPELESEAIVRPERFIVPGLSGLAVPCMTVMGNEPTGRWTLYVQWPDGRREKRAMDSVIDLPEGKRLWIYPKPSEPTPNMKSGWSLAARNQWLKGEPAPNPAETFRKLCERIAFFLDLPPEHARGITSFLALWIMLTYCYPAWDAVPYLYVGGPLGSGKSRVFEVLLRLAFRALSSSNMTGPALFRTLHSQGGVLLLDEAERLKSTQDPSTAEILSMLLAGYKRGGTATRLESVGDSFKTVSFDVYGPKALACISGLPPALASRCITTTMFRASPGSDKPKRRIDGDPIAWQALRDDLHALALEYGPMWLALSQKSDVCPRMSGRDYELWQPILALASWIESYGAKGLLALLQDYALAVIDRNRDETVPDTDETLLSVLTDAVRNGETPIAQEILNKALEIDPAGFKNWRSTTVAYRLKSYGIPKPKKSGNRREYRDVTPELLRRIQQNYGIDLDFPINGNAV